jgi:hypothetical protein
MISITDTPREYLFLYLYSPNSYIMSEKKKLSGMIRKSDTPKAAVQQKTTDPAAKTGGFAFTRENYRLLIIGLALIFIGFLLMIGGGSEDPKVFSYGIFNFQRMTLAPILILAGYVVEIFAIMKKPKD